MGVTDIDQPVWLKVMEHGAAGEARTKAFLLDRFWVLERSVDIDGADFLIQPRILSERFTDRTAPRIGIVQAKYFQDRRTTHHIPCRYVLDDDDRPLKGFFAILHLGREDGAEIFLLSADDIVASLERTEEVPSRFIVGAKALDPKFQVQSRRQALDRIEHELKIRSPLASFHLLDKVNIPYRKVSEGDIDYRYTLPIPNSQADIPGTYQEYRDKLRWLTYEMEEALVSIDTILQTTDPRLALAELAKLNPHRGGSGNRDYLMFGGFDTDLSWSYLPEALDEHDRRVKALEAIGLLTAYVDLSAAVQAKIQDLAKPFEEIARDGQFLWAALDYDPATLKFGSIDLKLMDRGAAEPPAALSGTVPLHVLNKAKKVQVLREAGYLGQRLMTDVLLALCPDLRDEAD